MHDDVARGLWRARLRWRMRGAWLWPSFAIAVFGDAVLMHELPLSGDSTGLFPALLEAGACGPKKLPAPAAAAAPAYPAYERLW